MMNDPCSGFSFIASPHSRLMMSWIARTPHRLSRRRRHGLVKALVCNEFALS